MTASDLAFTGRLCVTGGVASGKSYVTRRLCDIFYCRHFCADSAVHALLESDESVVAAVAGKFPDAIMEGKICRRILGQHVFGDANARQFLEELLHPKVYAQFEIEAAAARDEGTGIIAEIPLLFETQAHEKFTHTVLICTSPKVQIERLQAHRRVSAETAQGILAAQWPNEKKIPFADFVVWNDGTLSALENQIELLVKRIVAPEIAQSSCE